MAARVDPSIIGAGYGWVQASHAEVKNVEDVPVIVESPPPNIQAPPPPDEGEPSAKAIEFINVRTGPGTCYPSFFVAQPGGSTPVTGKSTDGGWWQVSVPTELEASGLGWVSASYAVTAKTENVPVVDAKPCEDAGLPPPGSFYCVLTAQSPADYSTIAPNTSFDMSLTVANSGSTAWENGVAKFVQSGATGNLHARSNEYALGSKIKPGETYNLVIPAKTGSSAGLSGEAWEIVANNEVVCQFWIIIDVQ